MLGVAKRAHPCILQTTASEDYGGALNQLPQSHDETDPHLLELPARDKERFSAD
jgi:hypothetical protein